MSGGKFLKKGQVTDKILDIGTTKQGSSNVKGQSYIMPMISCDII